MQKVYTHRHIDQFFSRFKELPVNYKIEKVHQLINNPDAKAKYSTKINYKLFKFLLMTSLLLIGFSALWFWQSPKEPSPKTVEKNETVALIDSNHNGTSETSDNSVADITKQQDNAKPITLASNELYKNDNSPNKYTPRKQKMPVIKEVNCSWPLDTTIDKSEMFVYLTHKEIAKLGVTIEGNSLYYINQPPGTENKYQSLYNWNESKPNYGITHNYFTMRHLSDINCTEHHWDDPFYSQIDTLIPVVVDFDNAKRIFWFSAHPDLFKVLPDKYKQNESLYDCLRELKKKNPNHQIINYWTKERNIILDEINSLKLTTEELHDINISIDKDTIGMNDPTNSYRYERNKYTLNVGTYTIDGSKPPEIPDMFPVIITDIKGLKQHTFGNWIKNIDKKELPSEMLNTLVPIFLPLSEIISTKDYDLVMWYYPSDNFVNALPDRIRGDLKIERDAILTGISAQKESCTYFESCNSSLNVEYLSIYPNPAKESININFSIPKETKGNITLLSINGALIKELITTSNFSEGDNRFTSGISDIGSGIYLVMIQTEIGYKTQRLIISK